MDFKKIEEDIREYWKKEKVFQRLLERDKDKKEEYVFYEGPPFANGKPGIHHVLARAFKDAVIRYQTMRGFRVPRKAGWDTHGLPTEMEAEKKLNLSNKKEIEEIGLDKFTRACQESVFLYINDWRELTERMAYWLDLDDPYITCSPEYMENVWGILKRIWEKGLLYKSYKVIPYCPRCGTTLSSHEVAQGYREIEDESVFVKLKVKDRDKYFLVWTTTPWTLTANVALAVNREMDYLEVEKEGANLILAKERLEVLGEEKPRIVREMKGKDLVGLKYEPIFKFKEPDYSVVAGDFVGGDEGTGIVHIAPAFGEEDMELAKTENLPVLLTIDEEGKFSGESKWKGIYFEKLSPLVAEELEKRKILFKKENYFHKYPFCWRCDTKLLYYPKESWFLETSNEEVKKRLIENNKKIKWRPNHLKEGRFGKWLEGVKDWVISRERYWGTPLPFWECEKCGHKVCIGSVEELKKKSEKKIDSEKLHRPHIDQVSIKCEKCGGEMKRVEQVLDCWFDSGSMFLAQNPGFLAQEGDLGKLVEEISFPADFICEGIDQTRGWFYSLLAIATLLELPSPYRSVIGVGMVLDSKGKKMSKSKGNVVKPLEVFDEYGADSIRWYFYRLNEAGKGKRFDPEILKKEVHKFFRIVLNTVRFLKIYSDKELPEPPEEAKLPLLDKWLANRQRLALSRVKEKMDDLDILSVARELEDFVYDMSQWYLRSSRERLKESKDSQAFFLDVLRKTAKMIAPFAPFLAEKVFQDLKGGDSVHLSSYPEAEGETAENLLREMEKVRKISETGRFLRKEVDIGLRQPLSEVAYSGKEKLKEEFESLLAEELSVKKVSHREELPSGEDWIKDEKNYLALNREITPELEEEGIVRELSRKINYLRKKAGLMPEDKVNLVIEDMEPFLEKVIQENMGDLPVEDLLKKAEEGELAQGKLTLKEKTFTIKIKKP